MSARVNTISTLLVTVYIALPAHAQSSVAPPAEPTPAQAAAPPEAAERASRTDAGAAGFLLRCAGCHTIGGGEMRGPDLRKASQWPEDTLRPAIKRMEKHTGALADADITRFVQLLKDPQATALVAREKARTAQAMAAKLDPPNARIGQALFAGSKALSNGGMACAACHYLAGQGGGLGPDLTGLGVRMDKIAMVSAFEQANFPVMRAAYATRRVTQQEAVHLVAYVAGARGEATQQAVLPAPVVAGGAGLALAGLILIALTVRGRAANVRRRLVGKATRR